MNNVCPKCDGAMESGAAEIVNAIGADPDVVFLVAGTATSLNPIKSFQQGLHEEPTDRHYPIRGYRCVACGYLEFFASEKPTEYPEH